MSTKWDCKAGAGHYPIHDGVCGTCGDESAETPDRFSKTTAWPAEGSRVGMISCLRCGAAILLDPRSDVDMPALHLQWHHKTDRHSHMTVGRIG